MKSLLLALSLTASAFAVDLEKGNVAVILSDAALEDKYSTLIQSQVENILLSNTGLTLASRELQSISKQWADIISDSAFSINDASMKQISNQQQLALVTGIIRLDIVTLESEEYKVHKYASELPKTGLTKYLTMKYFDVKTRGIIASSSPMILSTPPKLSEEINPAVKSLLPNIRYKESKAPAYMFGVLGLLSGIGGAYFYTTMQDNLSQHRNATSIENSNFYWNAYNKQKIGFAAMCGLSAVFSSLMIYNF